VTGRPGLEPPVYIFGDDHFAGTASGIFLLIPFGDHAVLSTDMNAAAVVKVRRSGT